MGVFKWRRRSTKHFGDTWVPFVQVDIQGGDNHWHSVAMQVDSGAVVTLLRRSTADLLGLSIQSGREVELGSVGDSRTTGYVHELQLKIGESLNLTAPCAFALTEQVPNLLGRAGVFDRLQIDFDASVRETKFSAPWLDEEQRRIYEGILDITRTMEGQWHTTALDSAVEKAVLQFYNRGGQLVASAAGFVKLHRPSDCPIILRVLFELAAQYEYLMRDPNNRAKQYLEFKHVSQWRLLQANLSRPEGEIGHQIANSRYRPTQEPALRKEFERVERKFRRDGRGGKRGSDRKPSWWENWTCKSLRDVSKEIGWGAEYVRCYKQFSGWVHGDPFATSQLNLFNDKPHHWLMFCYMLYARILRRIADEKAMVLTSEHYDVLRCLEEGSLS